MNVVVTFRNVGNQQRVLFILAFVTLANNSEARRAAKLINGQLFKGKRITVTLAPTSSSSAHSGFLVVGNLPFDYSEDQFRKLMTPHGEIKRLFLVRNKNTGQSKGYGFVEYTKKEHAVKAKEHFTTSNAKFVNNRIIRVDIATGNQLNGKDQHSKTLFIDHLPKSFDDEGYLEDLFRKTGRVAFCKVSNQLKIKTLYCTCMIELKPFHSSVNDHVLYEQCRPKFFTL